MKKCVIGLFICPDITGLICLSKYKTAEDSIKLNKGCINLGNDVPDLKAKLTVALN